MNQVNQKEERNQLPQISLLLILAQLGIILLKRTSLPEKVPFFYSRPWGQDQLATADTLFLLPLFSFIILSLSLVLKKLLKDEDFLSWLSRCFALLFSFLAGVTLFKIIFLIS
jgi:hypothetical protein